MTLHFTKLSWKKIIKQRLIKGEKLKAIPHNLRSMLFLSHRSMEIEQQKESSNLIGREYDNGDRRSVEKRVKNMELKGRKRMRIEGARRNPSN